MKTKLLITILLAFIGLSANSQCNANFSYTGSPYCSTGANPSPTYSGGGVAGTFSSTGGLSLNTSTGAINLALSTPGTYTVTNTVTTNGGCTATATVIIHTPPSVASAGPSQTVCGSTAALAGNTPVNGTGQWSLVAGMGIVSNPSSPASGITSMGSGANVFQWTISNAPCASSSSQVTITSGTPPDVAIAGPNQTLCGTVATLGANMPFIGTGLWTLVSGSGIITTPTSDVSGVTNLGVGLNVFQWTISNPPCPSSSSQVTLTVLGSPTVSNAGPSQSVCASTCTMSANLATVGTGMWTLISGGGTITTPTSEVTGITGLAVGPNVFQWTISNLPCAPSSSQVTITRTASPTFASAGPNQAMCGTTATLAGNPAAIGTGVWTLVSGGGTITNPSSPNTGLTALAPGANVFQWTISNPPCPASSSQVTVTSIASPTTSNAGPTQNICGNTCTMAANTATVGTGQWNLISGAGTITSLNSPTTTITGLGTGTNIFQWTISNAPCPPSTSQVTINVGQVPSITNVSLSQAICDSASVYFAPTSNVAGTTFSYTAFASSPSVSGYSSFGMGNIADYIVNTGNTTETVTYTFTPTGPGPMNCVGTPVDFVVTINHGATTANAGANQIVCGANATLSGNTALSGTGLWTLVSGTGTITSPTSPTTTVTNLGSGNNVFQWTISSVSCGSSSDQVTVTPTPDGVPICLVTVDSLSTHNIVVWEKSGLPTNTLLFKIYREDITNIYTFIGTVMFDSLSVYHDHAANPNVTGKRYKLSLLDSCYNESAQSPYHNTIWLNYLGSGILSWTPYLIEGQANPVLQYKVFRDNINNGTWAQIGTTAGTQYGFTDINYASFPTANYRVEIIWAFTCTPTRNSNNTTLSNTTQTSVGISEINNQQSTFTISPNPFTSETTISFNKEIKNTTIYIRDVLGKEIKTFTFAGKQLIIDKGEMEKGIYFVQIGNVNRKIVIQ